MTGTDVCMAARQFIGVPWRHQGRSREGIDCAGLVIQVAHRLKLLDFDTVDYSPQATDETMLRLCGEHLVKIGRVNAKPGDVPVMRFGSNRHIGIFGDYAHGGLSLIHAFSRSPRRVVEHRYCAEWLRTERASLIAVFRFPGIT